MGTVVMGKKLAMLAFAFLTIGVSVKSGYGARPVSEGVLRDGFVLSGVAGKLIRPDSNEMAERGADSWFFELGSDVNDGFCRVKAGAKLELLPSSTLENMISDMKERSVADYRLRARVTRYRGRNFLFPTYFLPLSKTSEGRQPVSQESQGEKSEAAIKDPNDILVMPEEMIKRLKTREAAPAERTEEGIGFEQDPMLIDRIGFVRGTGPRGSFTLDAFGRNAQRVWFRLLPCEALERAEREQSEEVEQRRFKVAGIVTMYKGRRYLLLQKSTRVYSYGNFPG